MSGMKTKRKQHSRGTGEAINSGCAVSAEGVSDLCPMCSGGAIAFRRVIRADQVAICGTCGTWYRVPCPTSDELSKIYDRNYYDAWGLDDSQSPAYVTKRTTFLPVLTRIKRILEGVSAESINILDVGAATGFLLEVASQMNFNPFAVEVNPFAAEQLRHRFGAEKVFEGELSECTFPRSFFHAITMTDLIEHVLDVRATLRSAGELLVRGGILCITTPRIDSHTRFLMRSKWLHFKIEHIQYPSRRGMKIALQNAGFSDVRFYPFAKYLSLDYLYAQLQAYPHRVLSPVVSAVRRLAPMPLRRLPVRYLCGEMLVTARTS